MLTSDGCSAAGRPLRHVPLLHFRCAGALCLGTCATALGPALHGSPPDGVIAPSICRNQRGSPASYVRRCDRERRGWRCNQGQAELPIE